MWKRIHHTFTFPFCFSCLSSEAERAQAETDGLVLPLGESFFKFEAVLDHSSEESTTSSGPFVHVNLAAALADGIEFFHVEKQGKLYTGGRNRKLDVKYLYFTNKYPCASSSSTSTRGADEEETKMASDNQMANPCRVCGKSDHATVLCCSRGSVLPQTHISPTVGELRSFAKTSSSHVDQEAKSNDLAVNKTATSAVSIVPPKEFWPAIQRIRSMCDRSYQRWMPHVNVLFPFIPRAEMKDQAVTMRMRQALSSVQPFTLEFSRFDILEHKNGGCTVYIVPEAPSQQLHYIFDCLQNDFPAFSELARVGEDGYLPHLTVGYFPSKGVAQAKIEGFEKYFQPFSFVLDHLCVLTRTGKDAFELFEAVPLGGMSTADIQLPSWETYSPTAPSPLRAKLGLKPLADDDKEEPFLRSEARCSAATRYSWKMRETYSFDEATGLWGSVDVAGAQGQVLCESLKVVTWNILFDEFEEDKIHTHLRLPVLLSLLEKTDADIIGLQEVTPELLVTILASQWIREHYYVSESEVASTFGVYGQLILSKYPFHTYTRRLSSSKHFVAAEMRVNGRTVVIPVVHLTSNHSSGMQRRIEQMQTLYEWLYASSVVKEAPFDLFVIGDFNFSDGEEGTEYAVHPQLVDVWQTLRPSEAGFTFHPEDNVIAAITTLRHIPRRLDRIYVDNKSCWKADSVEHIGTEVKEHTDESTGELIRFHPSDHYGVVATFHFEAPAPSVEEEKKEGTSVFVAGSATESGDHEPSSPGADDKEALAAAGVDFEMDVSPSVKTFVREHRLLDDDEGNEKRLDAIETIRRVLAENVFDRREEKEEIQFEFALSPTGSFGIGTHSPTSDIDIVVVSAMRRSDFFDYAPMALRNGRSAGVIVKRVLGLRDAIIPIIMLDVNGVEVDLQYCRYDAPLKGNSNFTGFEVKEMELRRMDVVSQVCVQSMRDCHLLSNLPRREAFRLTLSLIVFWAKKRGLYGNKFGYFGQSAWAVLLARVMKVYRSVSQPHRLLPLFFAYYASMDWKANVLSHDIDTIAESNYNRNAREKIVVLTASTPRRNILRNVNISSRRVIRSEMQRAAALQHNWEAICTESDFFTAYNSYIELSVMATNVGEYRKWSGWVQSRIIGLVVKINQMNPEVTVHVWPHRLTPTKNTGFDFAGVYYMGMSRSGVRTGGDVETIDKYANQSQSPPSSSNVSSAIAEFRRALDEYQNRTKLMDARIRCIKSVTRTPVDVSDNVEDDTPYKEVSDEDWLSAHGTLARSVVESAMSVASTSSTSSVLSTLTLPSKGNQNQTVYSSTLRPSKDVYNRILWDPTWDSSSVSIVYEDRFLGLQEKPFDAFNKVEEEWMPWHRVWYFLQNGEIIWDRQKRIDRVCSS